MTNNLAKQFTFKSLLLFALPNIIMMVFLSLYTIIDGIFVSRFVGTTALSAVNMMYPLASIEMAIGIMLSTGSSAIIAKKLGEGNLTGAKKDFSFIILITLLIGISFSIVGNIFINDIVYLLGSSDAQFALCKVYGQILLFFAPFFFLQTAFQTFFITAGKPTLGLITTIAAGITNIILDYIFIVPFNMGIAGAALATGIGFCIPSLIGILYFSLFKKGTLHFIKPNFNGKLLLESCYNGSSEMITNLATAVTTFLFNYAFMKVYGEDGVASITIILYFQFVFTAIYFGYSMGVAPIISYKYGAKDILQLKKVFKSSIIFLIVSSIFSFGISILTIEYALSIFTEYGSNVFNITIDGFPLFSLCFLTMGISIFASSMFTALSDGKTSAIISFARTFIFLVGGILILPNIIGELGLWLAVPLAEILGLLVSLFYFVIKRKKYNY